jgi:hypothetical protein
MNHRGLNIKPRCLMDIQVSDPWNMSMSDIGYSETRPSCVLHYISVFLSNLLNVSLKLDHIEIDVMTVI